MRCLIDQGKLEQARRRTGYFQTHGQRDRQEDCVRQRPHPTPRGESEFYPVKKAWVFGSTIKGSDAPNDLDVLLFAENAGAR